VRSTGTRQAARLPQRLGRPAVAGDTQDELASRTGVDSPACVYNHGAGAHARAQSVADEFAPEPQFGRRSTLCAGLITRGKQRPVGYPDRRHVTCRPQVNRQAGTTRMVATSRVDHQDIGCASKRENRFLKEPSLAQSEEPGNIGGIETASQDH